MLNCPIYKCFCGMWISINFSPIWLRVMDEVLYHTALQKFLMYIFLSNFNQSGSSNTLCTCILTQGICGNYNVTDIVAWQSKYIWAGDSSSLFEMCEFTDYTAPYHIMDIGIVEKFNSTIENLFKVADVWLNGVNTADIKGLMHWFKRTV